MVPKIKISHAASSKSNPEQNGSCRACLSHTTVGGGYSRHPRRGSWLQRGEPEGLLCFHTTLQHWMDPEQQEFSSSDHLILNDLIKRAKWFKSATYHFQPSAELPFGFTTPCPDLLGLSAPLADWENCGPTGSWRTGGKMLLSKAPIANSEQAAELAMTPLSIPVCWGKAHCHLPWK